MFNEIESSLQTIRAFSPLNKYRNSYMDLMINTCPNFKKKGNILN